jgi:AcrR family transcriptional regulator
MERKHMDQGLLGAEKGPEKGTEKGTEKGPENGNAGNRPRPRGRPIGRTAQGLASKQEIYSVALALIAERGFEATTLRDIAQQAGVSPGLLYRYFPGKRAVVLALYDDLSARYAAKAAALPKGNWRTRYVFALETSLDVLRPQRKTLDALIPVMVGNGSENLFAAATAESRGRVQVAFLQAVTGALDAPKAPDAAALGRLLYLSHLGIILLWLLDKSPRQRATAAFTALLGSALPLAALALKLKAVRTILRSADAVFQEVLFGVAKDTGENAPA